MMDENDIIKQKLMERSADLDVARQRWFFAFGASALFFGVVLVLFLLPISETSSEVTSRYSVRKEAFEQTGAIDAVAIPSTYWIDFDIEMDRTAANEHNELFVYLYKGDLPELSVDVTGTTSEALRSYFRSTSFRNGSITYHRPTLEWSLAFRDADTSRYYLIFYNPDDPEDPYDNLESEVILKTNYEPLLPLVPIFFILSFLIILPLTIIRVYVITLKKKELRVLLSLDLENLSNEDKVRLGIPISVPQHER
jgi:hypothetical protein